MVKEGYGEPFMENLFNIGEDLIYFNDCETEVEQVFDAAAEEIFGNFKISI